MTTDPLLIQRNEALAALAALVTDFNARPDSAEKWAVMTVCHLAARAINHPPAVEQSAILTGIDEYIAELQAEQDEDAQDLSNVYIRTAIANGWQAHGLVWRGWPQDEFATYEQARAAGRASEFETAKEVCDANGYELEDGANDALTIPTITPRSVRPLVLITMDGGCIHNVEFTGGPVDVEVRDFDTEGSDAEGLDTDDNGQSFYRSEWSHPGDSPAPADHTAELVAAVEAIVQFDRQHSAAGGLPNANAYNKVVGTAAAALALAKVRQ